MYRSTLLFLCCLTAAVSAGCSMWPRPNAGSVGTPSLIVVESDFQISVSGSSSPALDAAVARYKSLIFYSHPDAKYQYQYQYEQASDPDSAVLSGVTITVDNPTADLQLGVDESYEMELVSPTGTLKAKTQFGAMRGLEALSQLIEWTSEGTYTACNASVQDAPAYAVRGLLIDTARHYLPLSIIKGAIDGLAYSKMNTLHWHIVDSQSFPLLTEAYPELANAAWSPRAVYSLDDVAMVVQYGLERGIRVVMEVDVPGHTESWPRAMPSLALTDCALFNPVSNTTFDVLAGVLKDLASVVVDDFFHLGGDEVSYTCWMSSKEVLAWLLEHHEIAAEHVYQYFEDRTHNITAGMSKQVIHWQEVFNLGINVPKETTVIHVWKDAKTLKEVVSAGYRGMMSFGWYLDHLADTWETFYLNAMYDNEEFDDAGVIGGEACMWGEKVDVNDFQARVWPKTAATAERLWSRGLGDVKEAAPRLTEHRCRLVRRGIKASPIAPGYCPWAI